jgi:hypothetical protein
MRGANDGSWVMVYKAVKVKLLRRVGGFLWSSGRINSKAGSGVKVAP